MPKTQPTPDPFGAGITPRAIVEGVIATVPTEIAAPTSPPAPKRKPAPKARAIIEPVPTLAPDVDALAASLGVAKTPGPAGPAYAPDTFVRAVAAIHGTLGTVRDALIQRQIELDAREKALSLRERAVQAREEAVSGLTALAPIFAAHGAPTRSVWSRLLRR